MFQHSIGGKTIFDCLIHQGSCKHQKPLYDTRNCVSKTDSIWNSIFIFMNEGTVQIIDRVGKLQFPLINLV